MVSEQLGVAMAPLPPPPDPSLCRDMLSQPRVSTRHVSLDYT